MTQKCAVGICPDPARRTVMRERYCLACAASVEQAAYMQSLPQYAAERVWYRLALMTTPPPGVTIPEPLSRIAERP